MGIIISCMLPRSSCFLIWGRPYLDSCVHGMCLTKDDLKFSILTYLLNCRSELVAISPRWAFLLLSVVAFLFGPRSTYVVFYTASAGFGLMLLIELLPKYWTGGRHR